MPKKCYLKLLTKSVKNMRETYAQWEKRSKKANHEYEKKNNYIKIFQTRFNSIILNSAVSYTPPIHTVSYTWIRKYYREFSFCAFIFMTFIFLCCDTVPSTCLHSILSMHLTDLLKQSYYVVYWNLCWKKSS